MVLLILVSFGVPESQLFKLFHRASAPQIDSGAVDTGEVVEFRSPNSATHFGRFQDLVKVAQLILASFGIPEPQLYFGGFQAPAL